MLVWLLCPWVSTSDAMLSVVLVPIMKDKCGKIDSKDNYRPVALASVTSKIVEMILLDRMSDELDTLSNQFGFKNEKWNRLGSSVSMDLH